MIPVAACLSGTPSCTGQWTLSRSQAAAATTTTRSWPGPSRRAHSVKGQKCGYPRKFPNQNPPSVERNKRKVRLFSFCGAGCQPPRACHWMDYSNRHVAPTCQIFLRVSPQNVVASYLRKIRSTLSGSMYHQLGSACGPKSLGFQPSSTAIPEGGANHTPAQRQQT